MIVAPLRVTLSYVLLSDIRGYGLLSTSCICNVPRWRALYVALTYLVII
jgi:hypothetical protein